MLPRPTVPLVLLLLATGCVAPAGDVTPAAEAGAGLFGAVTGERLPPPTEDLSAAIVSDHGAPYLHAVPDLHHGGYGLELVGFDPMTRENAGDEPLAQNSAYNAITVFGHLACVSHFAGSGGAGGATIVNFSDPAKPFVVASIPSTGVGARCQFTEDGRFLLVADYGGLLPGTPLPEPFHNALSFGLSVYDVADVANPRLLTYDSQGAISGDATQVTANAYHNVGTALINGTNYVFQTYTGNVLALADDGASLEVVATVEHSDHDMWVGRHPITGQWLYVTGAGAGTAFYDVEDPTSPVLLGLWEGNGTYEGWHRQWPLAQTVGGRAIMVVAGEACGNGKSLPYTVLDFTDPTSLVELGHWQIPGNPEIKEPGQLCSMNSHEFNTWNGYVATGNYHAGVWVFDVGTPERAAEPVTIGYYLPNEDPRAHGGTRNTPFAWNPDVWGAYFDERGYILAADWSTGFYVLEFGATRGG